jgi:ABC-2 type transport system permease protein
MNAAPATTLWFARHELRLAWRDWLAMMTGGRRRRRIGLVVGLSIAAVVLHLLAYGLALPWLRSGIAADKATLLVVSGAGFTIFTVMLSQAIEAVTRVYYARSDLDLILASPASSRRLFAVRTGGVWLSVSVLSGLLAMPLINVLAVFEGPRWLAGYGVVAAMGALATALALAITVLLFRLIGPRMTRLIAQIVAAVVGAGFVILIQGAGILYYGSYSRFTLFEAPQVLAAVPEASSWVWLPARAVMGDWPSLLLLLLVGAVCLAAAIGFSAASYGRLALSTTGLSHVHSRRAPARRAFPAGSQRQALRRKEWRLLLRDPWLVSQTLMQLLYLIPPALLLWINFGEGNSALIIVVPVLVMAAGQLAGGLAWLAISGEDAHDLVTTAPLTPATILRAKVEAVLIAVGAVMTPLLLLLALSAWSAALAAAACAAAAASASTAIQLWFRIPQRRSMFRRRQVASRAATLCEALSSIMWAGTGALAATGSLLAIGPAVLALLTLALARFLSPRHNR